MGCYCLTPSISIYENEICTELVSTHKDILSEKRESIKSCELNRDKNNFYSKSKQNSKKLEIKENSKNNYKSYTLNKIKKNNELFTPNKILTRLSVEKFNELFDDSNIERYNNTKSSNNIYFGVNSNIFNFSSENNITTSLNSTFEQTFHNTIKRDHYKKKRK